MDEQMKRKYNLKLYAVYKMFSWDLLFFYAISLLFLNITKGFSVPQILFVDAFYPLFKIIVQIGCMSTTDLLGKRKSLLIGNLFVSASILILILGDTITTLFIANFVMAIGFVLKELCEPIILDTSIPENPKKADMFSRIDGRGSTYYYFLDAISSISTGFLFVVNGYLPIILCFCFCLIATLISYNFNDIELLHEKQPIYKRVSIFKYLKNYIIDLIHSFKFIIRSKRLKGLLMFSALFTSFLSIFPTFRSNLLLDLNVDARYFGIIVAIGQIISGIATKKCSWFHRAYRNRLLTWCAFPAVISLILAGLAVITDLNIYLISTTIGIMIVIVSIVKGPFGTLIKRYFNSFSTPALSTKIYAAKSLFDSFMRILVFLFASFLLHITTIDYAILIFGCLLTVTFIFLLDYMKTRVGLKPDEYDKKDIEFKIPS